MKAINAKYQEALDAFYKNPSWKMVYDAAPSDAAKEFLEDWWYYSHWLAQNKKDMPPDVMAEHEAYGKEIEKRMTKQDFEFIASIAPHPKCREHYLRMAASAK